MPVFSFCFLPNNKKQISQKTQNMTCFKVLGGRDRIKQPTVEITSSLVWTQIYIGEVMRCHSGSLCGIEMIIQMLFYKRHAGNYLFCKKFTFPPHHYYFLIDKMSETSSRFVHIISNPIIPELCLPDFSQGHNL